MTKTILGIFDNRDATESAIAELEDNGYRSKDISIVMKDQSEARDIANSTGTNVAGGAAAGATTGAVIGGLAGLLIGVGAIAIPGIGALLVAGPLAAALGLTGAAATTASGAVTGAVAGGLIGALMSMGLSRDDAELYNKRITEGAILLAVPAQAGNTNEVRSILEDNGATDVRTIGNEDRLARSRSADDEDYVENNYADTNYRADNNYRTDENFHRPIAAKGGRTVRRRRVVEEE